jgi:hypothetical protein
MQVKKTDIEKMLMTRDDALIRALYALHERQTRDEQAAAVTRHHNNKGFKPCDARKGSGMVNFHRHRGYLTVNQIAHWRKVMPGTGKPRICSYAAQLLIVAKEKAMMREMQSQPKIVENFR